MANIVNCFSENTLEETYFIPEYFLFPVCMHAHMCLGVMANFWKLLVGPGGTGCSEGCLAMACICVTAWYSLEVSQTQSVQQYKYRRFWLLERYCTGENHYNFITH